MHGLADQYNSPGILLAKHADVSQFLEHQIIPDESAVAFYPANGITLGRKYAGYMSRVQDIHRLFRSVGKKLTAAKRLRSRMSDRRAPA